MVVIATSIPTALYGKSDQPTWILDLVVNNHMTGELSTFISPFTPIDQYVHIADGSTIPICSQGDARLSPDPPLSSVYYVPNFAYISSLLIVLPGAIIVLLCSYPIVVIYRT